jgi:periplasmic divalent cation tolerance protein
MAATDAARPAGDVRESSQYLQVQTTTDSRAEAMELARAAVEARLAACGQVAGPVASTYWWNDEIERAEEWFVFLKLPADRYQALADLLAERHSYDEPEIIATPIVAGSPSFLGWLSDETRTGAERADGDRDGGRELGIPSPAGPSSVEQSAVEQGPVEQGPVEQSPVEAAADVPG